VVNEYVDAAQTGKNDDRAQFQAMMKVARAKKPPFQRIIVWKFSRFMRNRYQSAIYKTQLRKVGVHVFSLNEPTEDTATGRLMEGIIEAFDEFYSDNLAEDTSRGMRKNASLGYHNGGATPTGYRIKRTGNEDSPKNVLDPDPATAPLVQRMFRAVLDGEGAAKICRELNAEGIKTARGQPWSKTTVLNILRNPVYTGTLTFGKKTERRKDGEPIEPVVVENAHPALVPAEDFKAVQALIAGRTRQRIYPTALGSDYLLSGLL
jgi:DNA invertase Pin-like site-specific DNA recombinase